jgi:hypothetical protein
MMTHRPSRLNASIHTVSGGGRIRSGIDASSRSARAGPPARLGDARDRRRRQPLLPAPPPRQPRSRSARLARLLRWFLCAFWWGGGFAPAPGTNRSHSPLGCLVPLFVLLVMTDFRRLPRSSVGIRNVGRGLPRRLGIWPVWWSFGSARVEHHPGTGRYWAALICGHPDPEKPHSAHLLRGADEPGELVRLAP